MSNWFDNIRIYHLLIDRFNGGWQVPPKSENVFCGGNLQGVIEKLDYIKDLGFNAIMLSPIFKSANYHGYHTLNFEDVDPHIGTWDDYQLLLDKAHDKGMKIICDFVPNHCWYEAPVFAESLLKNGGKHRDWFFYPKEGSDEFVSFLGYGDLPKFNLTNPEVVSFMIDKAEKLARMGVDAFRIDHALGQPHSFLKSLRESLQAIRSDIMVFGEVWAFGIGPQLAGQLYFKTDARLQEFLELRPSRLARTICKPTTLARWMVCSTLPIATFSWRKSALDEVSREIRLYATRLPTTLPSTQPTSNWYCSWIITTLTGLCSTVTTM